MSVQVQDAANETRQGPSRYDLGWTIRRALLGLLILALGVGSVAWLTHASIDPAQDAAPVQVTGY